MRIQDIDHIQEPRNILVSVCMITYRHQAFIADAIEGVMMQQLHGRIELLISDDLSPDGTREICKHYQSLYPDRIRLLLPQENLGMIPNFIQCIEKCRGKYIAICEGDDYWTDPLKLQKQVATLESGSALAASAHNVQFTDEQSGDSKPIPFAKSPSRILSLEDVAPRRAYHTAALMFRRDAYEKKAAEWLRKGYASGDKVLNLALHLAGDIHYSEELMAVYRRHADGASTSPDLDRFMNSDIELYRAIAAEFSGSERTYILDCSNYYRIKSLHFKIRNRGTPKLALDYVALIPLVGRSRFLPWQKFMLLGKELYYMFLSICRIQLRKYLPGTKIASKQ